MNPAEAARRWAQVWQEAWEARQVEPIVDLYAADSRHWSAPFRQPGLGRDGIRAYVQAAFDEEVDIRARFAEPVIEGDRAAVSWWATLVENGGETTLAGTSALRFDDQGLVMSQWDSWNQTDGRREPPPGWGSKLP